MLSKMANDQSQLQRNAKQRADVGRVPSRKLIPEDHETTSDEQEGDERISAQEMADDDKISCDEQDGNDQIPSRKIFPDADSISADEEEGEYKNPILFMPNGDGLPSAERERVERILPSCKVSYSEVYLFEETEMILVFNEWN